LHARDVRMLSAAGVASLLAMIGFMETSFVWRAGRPCPAVARTGRSCTACGGTRAWRHAMRGDIQRAVRVHPPGALVGTATWGLLLGATVSLITGRFRGAVIVFVFAVSLLMAAVAYQAWMAWVAFSPG
jgi:hypothetical protein